MDCKESSEGGLGREAGLCAPNMLFNTSHPSFIDGTCSSSLLQSANKDYWQVPIKVTLET